ncbi:MAG: CAP domain-containing protein [Candidatus Sericytochromatia bacterium]|nr:CAP domain-containing protein [Candidatus Tanganyikabacteria bacterium]
MGGNPVGLLGRVFGFGQNRCGGGLLARRSCGQAGNCATQRPRLFGDRSQVGGNRGCRSCLGLGQDGGQAGAYAAPAANGYGAPAAAGQAAEAAPAGGAPDDANERALFELINRTRQQLGLNPLAYDATLAPTARRSAQARRHTGAPEIIAWGQGSPEQALQTWRNSPPHWNILTSPNLTAMGPGWVGDAAGVMFR